MSESTRPAKLFAKAFKSTSCISWPKAVRDEVSIRVQRPKATQTLVPHIKYSLSEIKSRYCSESLLDRYIFAQVIFADREASFVHAISSAGVAHAVTRSCSSGRIDDKYSFCRSGPDCGKSGELENCGCDRSLRGMSPEGFQVTSH